MAVEIYDFVPGMGRKTGQLERVIAMHEHVQAEIKSHAQPIRRSAERRLGELMAITVDRLRLDIRDAKRRLRDLEAHGSSRDVIRRARQRVKEAESAYRTHVAGRPKINGAYADVDYHVILTDSRPSRGHMYYTGYHGGRKPRNVLTDSL